MPKDVLPPANEGEIMDELRWLLRDEGGVRIEGPRTTLAEYWRQGQDLLICCANLLPDRDGGPLRVFLPGIRARTAAWLRYPETDVQTVTIRDGLLDLPACPRFAAVRVTL
jgi:hypothetical protein